MKNRPIGLLLKWIIGILALYAYSWVSVNYLGFGDEHTNVTEKWLEFSGLFTSLFVLWEIYKPRNSKKPES
ncbi:hypothetical protein [Corynebacterium gerontici]|uniref:Uncharacterized protein n=1 Tax=Corynebacterium gerontici TaxID=2079234 RepID=A0A3G6IXX6_9CORY|nr:hypothetical protein [Corynebacterium gerontici]AZA10413.1 hypothetical protein CGERO_00375 [Corynebacterium gerontici]